MNIRKITNNMKNEFKENNIAESYTTQLCKKKGKGKRKEVVFHEEFGWNCYCGKEFQNTGRNTNEKMAMLIGLHTKTCHDFNLETLLRSFKK